MKKDTRYRVTTETLIQVVMGNPLVEVLDQSGAKHVVAADRIYVSKSYMRSILVKAGVPVPSLLREGDDR